VPAPVFAVLALVGAAVVVLGLREALVSRRVARTWHPVPGTVVDAMHSLSTDPGENRATPMTSYAVRYDFPPGSPRTMRTDEATPTGAVDVGSVLTVHVNPEDPEEARVLAGWHGDRGTHLFFTALGAVFLGAGLLGLVLTLG